MNAKSSYEKIQSARMKIFEKFLFNLKKVYKKNLIGVEDIKLIIERDDIDYLK